MKETARLLGMPYTTYVNYEKEQREPTSEVLILLADFFGTSVDYLVGRSISHNQVSNTFEPAPSAFYLDPEEILLIQKYRRLDSRGKSAVINVLNFEIESLINDNMPSSAGK